MQRLFEVSDANWKTESCIWVEGSVMKGVQAQGETLVLDVEDGEAGLVTFYFLPSLEGERKWTEIRFQ